MVEKINVTKAALPPFNEYIDEIRDIWDSHWLTNMSKKAIILTDSFVVTEHYFA